AVLRAQVDLIRLAIELERPGRDVLHVAAQITGERYPGDSRHRVVPNRSVVHLVARDRATRPGHGHACPPGGGEFISGADAFLHVAVMIFPYSALREDGGGCAPGRAPGR